MAINISRPDKTRSQEILVMERPGEPHEALFFALAYLNLFELLTLTQVCRSMRDFIGDDVLLWLDIVVKPPLNFRINDDTLGKLASQAQGRLRSLVLMNCVRVTDDGLQRIVESNLGIHKLYLPSCNQLTPDGIIRAVRTLTEHGGNLKFLRLENIHNITSDHLQTLYSLLKINPMQKQPKFYLDHGHFAQPTDSNPLDIELCPKCKDVKVVFECPRETCRSKKDRPLATCKGCLLCVPRCEECGGCVDQDELEETACFDTVCLKCWLKLQKCNLCNKPYCSRHVDRIQWNQPPSDGFVCDACTVEMEEWLTNPC